MTTTSPIINNFFNEYDAVEYVYTEDIFDKSWFSKLFDKLDFIPYFLNESKRQKVCRLVNEKIASFAVLGYEVDILSHSLGSIIAMQSGRKTFPIKVNNMICLQPPTNSKIYGGYVRSQVLKYSSDITINNLILTWNTKDTAVANTAIDIKKMAKSFKGVINTVKQYKLGKGHDWELVLKQLISGGRI
jgi:hypothetical protein